MLCPTRGKLIQSLAGSAEYVLQQRTDLSQQVTERHDPQVQGEWALKKIIIMLGKQNHNMYGIRG